MAAGRTGPPLETAHVLCVDIVAYSAQPMETQRRWWEALQALVRQNAERSPGSGDCVRIPTGDGMALVFFRDPVAPLQCAIALCQALQRRPELRLRMGLHTGPVYRVADINAQANVAGGGINYAQRVMECGDAGHILLSRQIAEQVLQVEPWPLHDLGVCEVKHGERLHLFNLYRDEIGNPHRPQKLRAAVPPARPPAEPPDPTTSKPGLSFAGHPPPGAHPGRPVDPSPRGQGVGFRMEEASLSIRLLGAFEVRVGGQPLRSVRTRSVEWLLALLVLRSPASGSPRDLSRSWLAGTLWPESREAQGLFNLRRNLLDLRQALGAAADRLRTPNRATLCLDLTGADVDLLSFDAAIAAGDEASLQAAVALHRGPLLEGCVAEWVLPERASREEACLQALEKLADRAMERGELAAALGYLGQAAALDPLRDSTQRRRMEALTASGDLPAALLTYREHRLRLHRELNVEPDPETTRLFHQLRARGRDGGTGRRGDGASRQSQSLPVSPSPRLPVPPPRVSPSPLPRPLTALIGREAAVREVVQTVRGSRLVTLVGGGGVGKTRLAIQAAEELVPDFPAGVAFIELAALAEPSLLPAHLAAALGVREVAPAAGAEVTGGRGDGEMGGAEDGRTLTFPAHPVSLSPRPPVPSPILRALTDWLTTHPVLLVLDNCEHLIEAAAALAHALLSACPALRVLATSRQRLGLTGEVVWRVPSLPVPAEVDGPTGVDGSWLMVDGPAKARPSLPSTINDQPSTNSPSTINDQPSTINHQLSTLLQCPSVQLFVERAAAVRTGFGLGSREEALAVARICRRLDGIPLALELAAARVGLLTLPQIAARLDDRFRLLTGGSRAALPQHQTLAALIDWSYDLLPEAERALFRRLSVFAGGWTLEAAEAICSDFGLWILDFGLATKSKTPNDRTSLSDPIQNPKSIIQNTEVLERLGALEEKSLVQAELREGAIRYRMLETVRQYARERLVEAGEEEAARDRHRDWFLAFAVQAEPRVRWGAEQAAWAERVEKEHDNLRAALEWCLLERNEGRGTRDEKSVGPSHPSSLIPHPSELGLRAVGSLAWFWIKRGYLAEGWQRTTGLLAAGTSAPAAARGRALAGACSLAKYLSDSPAQAAAAGEALALGREAADPWLTAFALLHLGTLAGEGGDPDRAEALLEEGLSLARQLEDRWLAAELHQNLAYIAQHRGDYERARTLHQEALDRYRELEDIGGIAEQHMSLGWVAHEEGNDEQAKALWSEALAQWRQIGERSPDFLAGLRSLADLAREQGDPGTARAYYEEALAIAREMNHRPWTARALVGLARAEGAAGNRVPPEGRVMAARTRLEEADALDAGDDEVLMEGGHLLLELGDYAAARSRYEADLALWRERGHSRAIAWALLEAGHAAWLQGEPDITQSYAIEAMDLFQRRNLNEGMLAALENLGMAALAQEPGGGREERPQGARSGGAGLRGAAGGERAARLLGAAEALRVALGVQGPDWLRRPLAPMAEAVRAAALDPVFAAAWAEGRALSLDQAIGYALEEPGHG